MIGFLAHYDFWIDLIGSTIGILLYVATTHALQQRRHPAAAMSWMLMFLFLPFIALPAYILFGQRKFRADPNQLVPPWPMRSRDAPGAAAFGAGARDGAGWMSAMLESLGGAPVRGAQPVRLHTDSALAERALNEVIDSAHRELWVSTYVLGNDAVGTALIERLAAKAAAGVEVRLLLDGVGCFFVRHQQLHALTKANGKVARSFPPLRRMLKRQSNFRNHRKMVIADGRHLWMGGRNFASEYFGGTAHQPNQSHQADKANQAGKPGWPDLSLDCRGDLARDAAVIFSRDWYWACGVQLDLAFIARPEDPLATSAGALAPGTLPDARAPEAPASGPLTVQAQLLASGPDQPLDALQSFLVTACYRAQQRIVAVTPYLIPDPSLTQALALAAQRGIAVDLLLPRRSNHLLADLARNRSLRELSAAGVRIWLAPQMIHAKAVVFDDLAMTGSANLDIRSLFLNFELSLVLYDARQASLLVDWIGAHQRQATRYTARPASLLRDLTEGAVLWLGFQL